jgi:integrase/recombinase XerD
LYDNLGMLTVYHRHNPALCKSTDRNYKRCACPTWVEGTVDDKYVRQSLKTRSWERAVAKVRKMEATDDPLRRSFVSAIWNFSTRSL